MLIGSKECWRGLILHLIETLYSLDFKHHLRPEQFDNWIVFDHLNTGLVHYLDPNWIPNQCWIYHTKNLLISLTMQTSVLGWDSPRLKLYYLYFFGSRAWQILGQRWYRFWLNVSWWILSFHFLNLLFQMTEIYININKYIGNCNIYSERAWAHAVWSTIQILLVLSLNLRK